MRVKDNSESKNNEMKLEKKLLLTKTRKNKINKKNKQFIEG